MRYILAILLPLIAAQCGTKPVQAPWLPPGPSPQGDGAEASPLIVDGRDSTPGAWPWQLSLKFNSNADTGLPPDFYHTCGASLIHEYFAMTAAHCVEGRMIGMNDSRRDEPQNFRVDLGFYDQKFNETGTQSVYIDMIIKFPRWKPDPYNGYPNDIAILRLTEPANLTLDRVGLACYPQDSLDDFTGDVCWITGWGKLHFQDQTSTTILQEAKVAAIPLEQCRELNLGYIRESHICAGFGSPTPCSGDSGGPFNCRHNGLWYAVGVTSWVLATCADAPAVYTRVASFWPWINEQIDTYNPAP